MDHPIQTKREIPLDHSIILNYPKRPTQRSMSMEWMRFLHVISAVTLLGLALASYFYFLFTYFKKPAIRLFVLKLTIILDALVIFPLIIFVPVTGLMLDIPLNILIELPWIVSSSLYLLLALCCLFINLGLKIRLYQSKKFKLGNTFYAAGALQIIFLIAITHDMVIHQSILTFF